MNRYVVSHDGNHVAIVHHLGTAKKLIRQLAREFENSSLEIGVFTPNHDEYDLIYNRLDGSFTIY